MKKILALLALVFTVSIAYAEKVEVPQRDSIELVEVKQDEPKRTKAEKQERRQKTWKWIGLGFKGLGAIILIALFI